MAPARDFYNVLFLKTFGLKQFYISAGGGGVGKTFLINVVSKWAEQILRKEGTDPSMNPVVLLLGPTGKSAKLIGKFYDTMLLKTLQQFL